jgi:hypothetical protein
VFLPGFHLCDCLYVYNSRDFTTQEQYATYRYGWVGLTLFDKKSTLAVTMPIATAFKLCVGHRKKWAPESLTNRS